MNLHVITTLIIVLGLVLTLFCMVELRAGSRHAKRDMERYAVGDEDSGEEGGG